MKLNTIVCDHCKKLLAKWVVSYDVCGKDTNIVLCSLNCKGLDENYSYELDLLYGKIQYIIKKHGVVYTSYCAGVQPMRFLLNK